MKTLIFGLLASTLTLLIPITPFIYLVGLFILLDTFAALLYARANREKGVAWYKSDKFFNIAVKVTFYALAILASYGVDMIILGGTSVFNVKLLATKVLTILFLTNEMISINETYEKQYGESILTTLKRWMKKMNGFKKDLKGLITTDDKQD
jgi:Na+/alanine symporter